MIRFLQIKILCNVAKKIKVWEGGDQRKSKYILGQTWLRP